MGSAGNLRRVNGTDTADIDGVQLYSARYLAMASSDVPTSAGFIRWILFNRRDQFHTQTRHCNPGGIASLDSGAGNAGFRTMGIAYLCINVWVRVSLHRSFTYLQPRPCPSTTALPDFSSDVGRLRLLATPARQVNGG